MAVIAGAALLATGCGKKGPPLPPIVRVPAGIQTVTAQRLGSDIYLTVTVPTQNIDTSTPADIARIDIYAVTATSEPPRTGFLSQASRVATVPVAPVPTDAADSPATPSPDAVAQGAIVTLHEALTPAQFVPVPPRPSVRAGRGTPPPSDVAAPASGPALPRRFYVAIAYSDKQRSSPLSSLVTVPLNWAAPPPEDVQLSQQGEDVVVSWNASGGVIGFVLDQPLPVERPPFDDIVVPPATPLASDVPAGPTRYNVYRDDPDESDASAPPSDRATTLRPEPVNAVPLAELTFTDPAVFGRRRCYSVRAVRGARGAEVEGEASAPQCLLARDTVPPAAPANLTRVAIEGGITLLWDANTELDLAGYAILRGNAGSATLQRLTPTPIRETRYTDRTVAAGQRYVYAVVAVDQATPEPNVSAESNRVEETAR